LLKLSFNFGFKPKLCLKPKKRKLKVVLKFGFELGLNPRLSAKPKLRSNVRSNFGFKPSLI